MSIAVIGIVLTLIPSIFAYVKTPADAKFPMQWGLNGQVNWRAGKIGGVIIMPALAALILIPCALLFPRLPDVSSDPLATQVLNGTMWFQAILFAVINAGFMFFAVRDVNGK